ncbi:tripartite tricarboxylate transporter TctB family protein [Paracoccus sp. M683]|uniref:tripartite tricarboxylate transporter TctB family protein n=1 Tax=Paracoccus sp. M683 TaxID=2594268 RepID=UPI00163D71F4|nr:tripartite tricarboxylate transporter TctB family protein [Paracoccus sp. M683]
MTVDKRDFLGGVLLLLTGIGVAVHAAMQYPLGTLQRMGSGMFPFGAGIIMALLGLLVLIPAFMRSEPTDWRGVSPRALICVLASVAGFALVMPRFGLAPAIAVLVFLSSLGDRDFRIVNAAAVAVVMCVLSYLIFVLGLNLPFPMLRMPS